MTHAVMSGGRGVRCSSLMPQWPGRRDIVGSTEVSVLVIAAVQINAGLDREAFNQFPRRAPPRCSQPYRPRLYDASHSLTKTKIPRRNCKDPPREIQTRRERFSGYTRPGCR